MQRLSWVIIISSCRDHCFSCCSDGCTTQQVVQPAGRNVFNIHPIKRATSSTVHTRGVVVNFDLGERFPRSRSQQRGSLCPCARRVAVLGVSAGGGRPLPLRVQGCHPRKFFWDFWCRIPRLGGNLGQKINRSRVNLTSTTWFAGTLQC